MKHICNTCNTVHREIPKTAKPQRGYKGEIIGWHWQCTCNSTMFKLIKVFKKSTDK